MTDADLSLVPKTITDGGKTLTLANVNWSSSNQTEGDEIVQRYTASATYTGTSTSKSATGYTVKANYTGELSKTGCNSAREKAASRNMACPWETPPRKVARTPWSGLPDCWSVWAALRRCPP